MPGGPSRRTPGACLSPEDFGAATNVSRETLARLELYAGLLEKWTRSINLVGRDSLADLWRRHMLDSAQLLPLLPPAPVGRERVLVDLGSGAGFPGLVLAILGAGEVHLIESDGRKAAFLREAARETGVAATIHNLRIEALPAFAADVVTARACAPLSKLLGYAEPFVRSADAGRPGGTALFLKGRRVDEELTDSAEKWKMRVERFPSRSDPEGTILRLKFLDMGDIGRDTTIS
jgi:16S rRNA (guanine527-N7)-methyltransferase